MREVRGAHPLHPDETFGEMDAGGRETGGSDALHRAGQGWLHIRHAGRRNNPRQEERPGEPVL